MVNPTEETARKKKEMTLLERQTQVLEATQKNSEQQTEVLKETRKTTVVMVLATLIVALATFMQGVESNIARGIFIVLTSVMLIVFIYAELKKKRVEWALVQQTFMVLTGF